MIRFFALLISVISFIFPLTALAGEAALPRTIIALYDDRGGGIQTSYIHTLAEMPLNHLGLTVEYYDVNQPLPDITQRADVRGVIAWFFSDTQMDAETYLKWAENVLASGKKYVVMGSLGIAEDGGRYSSLAAINSFLGKIDVSMQEGWVENPLDTNYDYLTPSLFLTLQPYNWTRPPYRGVRAGSEQAQVHLHASGPDEKEDSDLIITSSKGGYISSEYIFRTNERNGSEVSQWYVNPYEFFRLAFTTDELPKPDTTTIAGRRIYYSHIDGDGWNNITLVEEYRKKSILSAQVIMDKIVKPFPDMPVTLTLIGAEINAKEAAVKNSREIAEEFFALPQVEAGSHTHSHPFYWQFFKDNDPTKEITFLPSYRTPTWKPADGMKAKQDGVLVPSGYTVPRAYAYEQFDIKREVEGSIEEISPLLPKDKKLMLLTWSGNCSPWEEAIRLTREAGLQNINGGDSRMDAEYPAYASLMPIGRQVGKERQIYASSSNENTYTNLWSQDFHAHRYLQATLENSEMPVRLKPLNIYYHIYAGERDPSLSALHANLEYARSQSIAPITASYFTHIAQGFYATQITPLAPMTWRVDKRGDLQTIRFDRHTLYSVDFADSKGVVGQRHFQGSLYVYLDASVEQPVIALKENDRYFSPPLESTPYLVESRWLISNVQRQDGRLNFTAQGFGPGEMIWQMAKPGRYRIAIGNQILETVDTQDNFLKVTVNENAMQPLRISITPVSAGDKNA